MTPDPGEPPDDLADQERRAAGVVPSSQEEPYAVHLLTWLAPLASEGDGRWSTACPADIADLPASIDEPREVRLMAHQIDCLTCLTIDPVQAGVVNAKTSAGDRGRAAAAAPVLAFLRWAREEKGMVIADHAGGVNLKPYPSSYDARFVQEWLDTLR